MDDADAALLRAAAAGDHEAYGRFARRHAAAVLRFCLLRLPDPHAAEDAAQEAMLRLFQQVRARRLPDEPLPWLLGVARRCCQESGRAAIRNGALPLPATGLLEPPAPDEVPDLRSALTTLNDFEAAVLHLKHTDGLRCQQIAARLGKPVGTVTAALSRAYAKLRAALRREVEA